MRARDDATRVMRGMGRAFGHLAKEQQRLAEASKQEAATSRANLRNIDQSRQAAIRGVKEQTKAVTTGYKAQRDAVVRSINAQKTAEIEAHRAAMRPQEQAIKNLNTRNAQIREQISLGRVLSNDHKKALQYEITRNSRIASEHGQRLGLYRQEIEAARNAARARITATDNQLRHMTRSEDQAAARRIAAINRTADADKAAEQRRSANVRNNIAAQQAYNQRIQQTQGLLAGVGQSAIIAGGIIGMVGARVTKSFFSAADATAEFSNQNRVAVSVAKDFQGSVEDLGDAVLKVAREVPVPIEELQETFYYTFSALDVDLTNATELVRGFADEAVVGNAKITDAARSSIAMINAYQMDVSSAAKTTETLTRIQDMQFNTVKWGALTYQDLSTNIGKVIPAATRAGQEIEQIGGMLAFLTRQGLSAEMAATSAARALELISEARVVSRLERMGVQIRDSVTGEMRQLNDIVVDFGRHLEGLDPTGIDSVMQALAPLDGDESQKYQNMLKEADRVTERLSGPERTAALHQIFMGAGNRIQARRFWDLALKNYDELDRLVKEITDGHGEFSKTLTLAWDEPAVALGIYNNRLEALKLTIGQEVLPIKLMLISAITNLVDKWEALDSETKANIVSFALWGGIATTAGGAAALIVGVLALITSGMMGIATAALPAQAGILKTVLVAAGMGVGIPLAIGAVVAALVLLVIHWDKVSAAIQRVITWWRELDAGSKAAIAIMGALAAAIAIANASLLAQTVIVSRSIAGLKALTAGLVAVNGALLTLARRHPILLALTVAIGAYIAISRRLSSSQRELESATKSYSDNLYANRDAIVANVDAIDSLNRAQLINRLEDSGLADQADELGVALKDLTDAMYGNEEAQAKVNRQLQVSGGAWERFKFSLFAGRTEYGRLSAASRELQAAIQREPAAMAQGTDAFVDRLRASEGVHKAMGDLIAMQRRGGPKDAADAVIIARSKEIISASEGVQTVLGQLPDDMQDVAREALGMAGAVESAEDAFDDLSPSAELLKSVLEDINDVEAAFGMSMGRIEEALRDTHKQALESGKITEDAFNDMFQEATKNADLVAGAWIDILRKQEEAHNDYMTNMQIIIARGASHVIDIINDMGEDAPAAMHVMANASHEEFLELERMLTSSAERTSNEAVAQMDALKEGMTTAISEGISTGLFDFNQGMRLMEANAKSGGKATAGELAKQLGIGVRDVHRIAGQFSIALTDGINPVLEGMGRDRVTLAQKRWLSGQPITNLHTGGKIPGYGGGDIFPAMLEPGELVVRKEIARKLDPQTLHELDIPGFQTGGFASVDDVPKVPSFVHRGPVVGHAGTQTATYLREKVVEWLEENLAPQLLGIDGQPPGVARMMAALHTRFPGLPLYSGFRPGAITATGNPSYHGMGRAVDIPPRLDVNKWIADNYFAQTKELILSLSGATQIKNGRHHFYTGITRAMHFDHNHWAMAQGGIVNSPMNALIGEAGPEAVIPLDRINALIRDAMFEVIRTPGEPGKGVLVQDQYRIILDAVGAVQGLDQARRNLEDARAQVGIIGDEIGQLKQAHYEAKQEFMLAAMQGRQMSLESEQAWINAQVRVRNIRQELEDMRSPVVGIADELAILQQEIRVEDLARSLEEMRDAQPDDSAIQQAQQRLDEAQATFKVADAEFKSAQSKSNLAQAELARVNRILPSVDDEVARLLMKYEAEANLADAQVELAKTEEERANKLKSVEDAEQALTEARATAVPTARELRMAEIELALARERLTELNEGATVTAEELRLKEIELALAERDLTTAYNERLDFSPEYYDAQERMTQLSEELRNKENELEGAVRAVTDAELANMAAIIGVMDATQALNGLQPEALRFFRSIGEQAGVSTDAINEMILAVRELNKVNTSMASVVAAHSGVDRRILAEGNIGGIAARITDIFRNRGVALEGASPGETWAQRVARIIDDIISGRRTFNDIRRSVDRIAGLATGGIALKRPGGTIVRVAEGRTDEAIVPLPSNWRSGGGTATETKIIISEGAVQITFEGPVGEDSMDKVKEAVQEGIHDLIEEIERDRRMG